MDKIRVVLADDQVLFVENLRIVLETRAKDIKVVGIARDGIEAVECVNREHPNIILMDVRMPNMDGVEATRLIHNQCPDTQVMMLTTFDDDQYVHEALHNGAVGYVLKNISPLELITTIRAVNQGRVIISPAIAAKLVEGMPHAERESIDQSHTASTVPEGYQELSKREKEVFALIARGYNNKEISEQLFVAEQTVKNYVHAVYQKIGARDRIQAVHIAQSLDSELQMD